MGEEKIDSWRQYLALEAEIHIYQRLLDLHSSYELKRKKETLQCAGQQGSLTMTYSSIFQDRWLLSPLYLRRARRRLVGWMNLFEA